MRNADITEPQTRSEKTAKVSVEARTIKISAPDAIVNPARA
jgi:hypothetical protein